MSEFRFSAQKISSLRHRIAENIRRAIFEGKLKPGNRIREEEIAKQMGVSRGPVREAILVLEKEGLLLSQPYKETVVAEFSKKEVIDVLIPIRLSIELLAIRKGLPEINDEDIERLTDIVKDMKDGADRGDLIKVVDSDLAFHEYLLKMSRYVNLINIWSSIYNPIRLHFILQTQTFDNLDEVSSDHQELLDVIKDKDVEKVCQAMSRHISDANLEQLLITFEEKIYLP